MGNIPYICFENSANACGNYWILYHKTNKEASTVLCSVVKHLGSARTLKKWGKTLDCVSCFSLQFFRALPLPACFTTEHSTVEASLFVNRTYAVESTFSHFKKKVPSLQSFKKQICLTNLSSKIEHDCENCVLCSTWPISLFRELSVFI